MKEERRGGLWLIVSIHTVSPVATSKQVLEHLFHFIARSFALHCHGRTAGDDTLKVSLNFFFNGLIPIMRAPADERDRKGRQIVEMQVSGGGEQLPWQQNMIVYKQL